MGNDYDQLLKTCGFESKEIGAEKARIEKAFENLI